MLESARGTEAGLTWASTPIDDEADHTLYGGGAGVVLALLEAQRHSAYAVPWPDHPPAAPRRVSLQQD
ncbi:hypothetical protein AB0M46_33470 [Dactylosporangium sp. NPDC051485]|uniref:hypothetical protein n=1 Tax=Dactylosporangium sp. NPDC051485 TaxID=3154846 RepID=UPI00342C0254